MRFYIESLFIIIYVLKDYDIYIARLIDLDSLFAITAYISLFLIVLSGLIFISLIQNNKLRILFGVVIYISVVFYDVYQSISSDFLTYNTFITLLNASGFIGEALEQYFLTISHSLITGLLILAGILLKPNTMPSIYNKYLVLQPVSVFITLSIMLFVRGGDGAKGLPSAYTPLAYSALAAYESANNIIGEREKINIERINDEINHDIILLVDESISANYLDIYSKNGASTSLNKKYKNINVYNFGYAAAVSSCSTETNITIRYGGTRNNYFKMISTMPSIWQYAKKANLHTVYIDAQNIGGELQNLMTTEEMKDIDEFIQYDKESVQNRDMAVSKTLIQMINNNRRDFIYVNKVGAHFPVHDKFPEDYIKYKPILPRGNYLDISDTGSREGFSGSAIDWIKYRNSYRNTIQWNIGKFFSNIFEGADLNNAVIVYTSDHGQDLHERGNPGLNTHCSPHPNSEEGLVPLVVIEGSSLKTLNWSQNLHVNKNRTSHFNIFPTLLTLMHYDKNKIKSIYGNSLNIKTDDEFTFNTRFHARLGKKPYWKKIRMNKIITPVSNQFYLEK